MKKILALVLSMLMVLSLFVGCGQQTGTGESAAAESTGEPEAEVSLQVGFGRVNVTPTESVPLAGRHTEDFSTGVVDPLYATCIAFTDGTGNTILLYHLDFLFSYSPTTMNRASIAKAVGVNGLQVVMTATHNHSGPNLDADNGSIQAYNEKLKEWMIEAAKAAMDDRKPVTGMYVTKTNPERLNFLRHHILADGSKTGWAAPAVASAVKHLHDADNELQLIKYTREGGKDVILMNWQAHPGATSASKYDIRSDVDVLRREL